MNPETMEVARQRAAQEYNDKTFLDVQQDFLLYATLRIGPAVPENVPGWYKSFTDLANADHQISFLDQQQEAEVGSTYTNMKKKTGLDWHCIFSDFGIGFELPDPLNVGQFDGDRAQAKMFASVVPQHCNGAIYIGGADNKILTFRPEQCPLGFGPSGNQNGPTASFGSLITNGIPLAGNRMQFANYPLVLPKDISISVRLNFSAQGKNLLKLMDEVAPISFANGEYQNEAQIKIAFRGLRQVQPIGNLRR